MHRRTVGFTSTSRCGHLSHHVSALCCLVLEHLLTQLGPYKHYLNIVWDFRYGARRPAPSAEHMNMVFPSDWGRVTGHELLLRNVLSCPCMLWWFRYSQRVCTMLHNRKLWRIGVPNTPILCCSTHYGHFFLFYSILLEYSNPAHPSPLAFIIQSLRIFFLIIALSLGGRFPKCLNADRRCCWMNGVIAGWHARHTDTIGQLPFLVIWSTKPDDCRTNGAAL